MFTSVLANVGASLRTTMSSEKQAMVVSPTEVTQAGRLDASKRLIGRVVETENQLNFFGCYLLCGASRKHLVQVEAWREMVGPAQALLKEGDLVAVSDAVLALRKPDKVKYSLSAYRLFIRFDKTMKVQTLASSDCTPVPGCDSMLLKDIARRLPCTSLQAAACLREGCVSIEVFVLEVMHKSNQQEPEKSFYKVAVQDSTSTEMTYQADILCWQTDLFPDIQDMEGGKLYRICPLSVMAGNDKSGFALRWLKQTKASAKANVYLDKQTEPVEKNIVALSARKDATQERKDYGRMPATLVAASTLSQLMPDKGSHKFSVDDVWELPYVTIIDILKNAEESWGYHGCSVCLKKSCTHSCPKRSCYNVDLLVGDHTTTIEIRAWTATIDIMLRACDHQTPEVAPTDLDAMIQKVRSKAWSLRCIISEEQAYQNRPARNRLELVSIKEQCKTFTGTAKALFALRPEACRPGIPYVFLKDMKADAAEQVFDINGQSIEMVEALVEVISAPTQATNEMEKGVRIYFQASDIGDPDGCEVQLMWVLKLSDMLSVARLNVGTKLRVVLQPCVEQEEIKRWQVIFYINVEPEEIDAWRARKTWQGHSPGDETKKRAAQEIAIIATPKTKYNRTMSLLASPSNIARTHAGYASR